jgi:hypothetical protein
MVESEKARETWLTAWDREEENKYLRARIKKLEQKGGEYGLDGSQVPPPRHFVNERDIDKRRT